MFSFLGIIIALIVGFIIFSLVASCLFVLLKGLFKVAILVGLIYFCFVYPKIGIPLVILLLVLGQIEPVKERYQLFRWKRRKTTAITEGQLSDLLANEIKALKQSDINGVNYKFDMENIPHGRVNAFLNFFDTSIYDEDVYYFSPILSSQVYEIREYGTIITNEGIYIAEENIGLTRISFQDLYSITREGSDIYVTTYNSNENKLHTKRIGSRMTSLQSKELYAFLNFIIDQEINHKIRKNKVIPQTEIINAVDDVEKRQLGRMNIFSTAEQVSNAALASALPQYELLSDEVKNYMHGIRGSGYAAEYGNNAMDRLSGKEVVNAGQILDGSGRQIKYGADRIVNGYEIQTKYYKTASESIAAAFEKKEALYIKSDGSEGMMQIEVPKDQYYEAVRLMQKRIDSGQVPNVQPGEDAHNYVRKGHFTYTQSFNIAQSGTVDSLKVDISSGIVLTSWASGISATIVFANAIWRGEDVKEAASASLYTWLKTMGRGVFVYTLTMQLTRDKIANPLVKKYTKDGITQGFGSFNNPIFSLSENVARKISTSSVATTTFGKAVGLQKIGGRILVSNAVTAVVVFGPDFCRALTGRISGTQLFKNSVGAISALGGAALGQTFIPIPILGALIGGVVANTLAKEALDQVIVDDNILMFQILKEEFLDVTMQSSLTEEEFNQVTELTIAHNKLQKMLQDMHQSGNHREYARKEIMITSLNNVISERDYITDNLIENGHQALLENHILTKQDDNSSMPA